MQPSILKPVAPEGNDKFRVLIVEDDVAVARLLLSSLASVNLECTHAADGLSGLEMFAQQTRIWSFSTWDYRACRATRFAPKFVKPAPCPSSC
jgi:CheY-like chemotaxis protein